MSLASQNPFDPDTFSEWIGKTTRCSDTPDHSTLARLSALLNYDNVPWGSTQIPYLAHWLFFLPQTPEKDLSPDGHPARGGFWPPITLPRRMWAGGRIQFLKPIEIGVEYERSSTISNIRFTEGKSGQLGFVTLRHDIQYRGESHIVEEQNLVYRNPASHMSAPNKPSPIEKEKKYDYVRSVTTTPITLFRFSALTYNSHRIHYDESFARDEEGYEERLVHGPLMAIMLMDHFRRYRPQERVREFIFRGKQPVFVNTDFDLCLTLNSDGASLCLEHGERGVAMEASVITE